MKDTITVTLPVIVEKECNTWIATFPGYVESQGQTKEEALKNLTEAVELYLEGVR